MTKTLITSNRGYASIKTTNKAGFMGKIPYKGCSVFNHPSASEAIQRPKPSEPVSPRKIFLFKE